MSQTLPKKQPGENQSGNGPQKSWTYDRLVYDKKDLNKKCGQNNANSPTRSSASSRLQKLLAWIISNFQAKILKFAESLLKPAPERYWNVYILAHIGRRDLLWSVYIKCATKDWRISDPKKEQRVATSCNIFGITFLKPQVTVSKRAFLKDIHITSFLWACWTSWKSHRTLWTRMSCVRRFPRGRFAHAGPGSEEWWRIWNSPCDSPCGYGDLQAQRIVEICETAGHPIGSSTVSITFKFGRSRQRNS